MNIFHLFENILIIGFLKNVRGKYSGKEFSTYDLEFLWNEYMFKRKKKFIDDNKMDDIS